VSSTYEERQFEFNADALSLAKEITSSIKQLRNSHISDLSEDRIEPYVNLAFTSSLAAYRAVRDHSVNIMEAMTDEGGEQ